jgi:hypothetical protein
MAIDEKDPIIKTLKTLRHCQSSTATERALPAAKKRLNNSNQFDVNQKVEETLPF